MSSPQSFVFRTVFTPIHGVDEDLDRFIREFELLKTVRFTHFASLWRHQKFIQLIYGRKTQYGLSDILGCVFHRLIDLVQPHPEKSQITRITALYLLYAFHGKQPIKNQVRIRVCPESWSNLVQLASEAKDEGHLDVYYVFRQMCAANAFAFCANRQVLYPGAPLFDSPQGERESDKSSTFNPLSLYMHLLKIGQFSGVDYGNMLRSFENSLSQYTEAKSTLSNRDDSSSNNFNVERSNTDEFLLGLNFINYPESIEKLRHAFTELDNQFPSANQSRKTENCQSPAPVKFADRLTVVSRNIKRIKKANRKKIQNKRFIDKSRLLRHLKKTKNEKLIKADVTQSSSRNSRSASTRRLRSSLT